MIKLYSIKGQTLLETVFALSAILVILTAITVVTTTALNNAVFEYNQNLAAKYAREGMEYIRYIQKTCPTTFNSKIPSSGTKNTQCLSNDASGTTYFPGDNCPTNNYVSVTCTVPSRNVFNSKVPFERTATFDSTGNNCKNGEVQVNVDVYWSSGKCTSSNTFCHKSELSSCLQSANTSNNL